MSDAAASQTPQVSALSPEELDAFTSKLVTALKTVYDPEIPVDIYELGLIYKVDVADNKDVAVDMKLTEAAAARLGEIMTNADGQYQGVRVGVTNGGCAGMSYTMEYASEAKPFEEVMEDKGVKIFIDPKAILFLIGTELDFVQEKLGARFVFNNPNQTSACGCGESVQITPAQAE